MTTVGWDLGGAHLKVAVLDCARHGTNALQLACPLWRGIEHLPQAMKQAIDKLRCADARHAVTMTGELADCFLNRREGVEKIVGAIPPLLPSPQIYSVNGTFLTIEEALETPLAVASANWHATARFVAEHCAEGLLIDIGSTTSDITLVANADVAAVGDNDHSRLANNELVYTGVVRTPLMSLASVAPFRGRAVNVMAELFSTTADIYRLTGDLNEDADQYETADGREKSIEASARRVARMIGCDFDDADLTDWRALAAYFAEEQLKRIFAACEANVARRGLSESAPVIAAGAGAFIARKVALYLRRPCRDISSFASACDAGILSRVAPAFAVAWLLERSARKL
jgi:probable H4MPT-linked C1 transfer pathway protein